MSTPAAPVRPPQDKNLPEFPSLYSDIRALSQGVLTPRISFDGRALCLLTMIDESTRECLASERNNARDDDGPLRGLKTYDELATFVAAIVSLGDSAKCARYSTEMGRAILHYPPALGVERNDFGVSTSCRWSFEQAFSGKEHHGFGIFKTMP